MTNPEKARVVPLINEEQFSTVAEPADSNGFNTSSEWMDSDIEGSSNDSHITTDPVVSLNVDDLEIGENYNSDNIAADSMFENFAKVLKQEFEREREKERAQLQMVIRSKIRNIENSANKKLRDKLSRARIRDKEKLTQREQHLNAMLSQLKELGTAVAAQKRELDVTRQMLEEKLAESQAISDDIKTVGSKLSAQMTRLGDTLINPGED